MQIQMSRNVTRGCQVSTELTFDLLIPLAHTPLEPPMEVKSALKHVNKEVLEAVKQVSLRS